MAMVTFTSDYGQQDEYVATVHAAIYSVAPDIRVVDITHSVPPYSISAAAYLLRSSFQAFPAGTLHIIGVETATAPDQHYKAVAMEGHTFIGFDNGIFSLISEHAPEIAVRLQVEPADNFPLQNSLLPYIRDVITGRSLTELGEPDELVRLLHLQPRITKNKMNGHVVHIDRYGNAAVNIPGPPLERFSKDRQMTIMVGRERISKISDSYNNEPPGEVMALINYKGYLEIAVNQGNAAELLGLTYESHINISFKPEI